MRRKDSLLIIVTMIEPQAGHTIAFWQKELEGLLYPRSDTARLDAQYLLGEITSHSLSWVMSHPEYQLGNLQTRLIIDAMLKLSAGIPLPYITGKAFFYNLEFVITPAVLIPRPETELMVEHALAWCASHAVSTVLDVGTGSGCIAISLATHVSNSTITAIDISSDALEIARQNAELNRVSERIHFLQGDLAADLTGQYDLVCANLPYIPTPDLEQLTVVRYEPKVSLDGGANGLELISLLLAQLPRRMEPVSCALLEIEYRQGEAAVDLAKSTFPAACISLEKDLAGNDRLLVIKNGVNA